MQILLLQNFDLGSRCQEIKILDLNTISQNVTRFIFL